MRRHRGEALGELALSASVTVMPRVAASIRSTAPPISVNGTYTPASVSASE